MWQQSRQWPRKRPHQKLSFETEGVICTAVAAAPYGTAATKTDVPAASGKKSVAVTATAESAAAATTAADCGDNRNSGSRSGGGRHRDGGSR